jgi:hypothetical protein
MIQKGKTRRTREKFFQVPLFEPQLSHGLAWDRTRVFAARGQRPVGMCVVSNLNSIRQFIPPEGTTIGVIRERAEETVY